MFGDTPLIIVESQQELETISEVLSKAPVIGVDTESDSFHHYQEKVCLIQISDLHSDYIIDPLRIDDISSLGPVLSNPDIVKVLHGADYDVVCLRRDFSFQFKNLFDTMVAAQMLGLPRVGLADLIESGFGHQLDKQYQRHDWAKRPLKTAHLEYARGDTHFLLALREILIHKLRQSGRMAHVEEECQILESREWVARPFDPDGYLKIKGSSALSDSSKRVLCRLYLYRDGQARQLDRPSFKVIPDSVLLALAKKQPTTPDSLNKLFAGKAPMKRRHGDSMLEAVRAGLEDDFAIPTKRKERPKGPKPKVTGRAAERGFQALKRWRNDLCANNDRLSPVTVVSNSTLKSIVQHYPTTIEQLTAIKEVRNWQVQEYGEQILEIIREVLPLPIPAENASHTAPSPKRKRKRRNSKQNKAEESSPESSVDS